MKMTTIKNTLAILLLSSLTVGTTSACSWFKSKPAEVITNRTWISRAAKPVTSFFSCISSKITNNSFVKKHPRMVKSAVLVAIIAGLYKYGTRTFQWLQNSASDLSKKWFSGSGVVAETKQPKSEPAKTAKEVQEQLAEEAAKQVANKQLQPNSDLGLLLSPAASSSSSAPMSVPVAVAAPVASPAPAVVPLAVAAPAPVAAPAAPARATRQEIMQQLIATFNAANSDSAKEDVVEQMKKIAGDKANLKVMLKAFVGQNLVTQDIANEINGY